MYEVDVVWVQLLQVLRRTEPYVYILEVIELEHVEVYLLLGLGLLSTSPASIRHRGILAKKVFFGAKKNVVRAKDL